MSVDMQAYVTNSQTEFHSVLCWMLFFITEVQQGQKKVKLFMADKGTVTTTCAKVNNLWYKQRETTFKNY